MNYAIKSLSVGKGDVYYEIHDADCPDNHKDSPLNVFVWPRDDTPQMIIRADIRPDEGEEVSQYRIMPCTKVATQPDKGI